MTQEKLTIDKTLQQELNNWFNHPITRRYIEGIRQEVELVKQVAFEASQKAMANGKLLSRSEEELTSYQILIRLKTILSSLETPYEILTSEEELNEEKIEELQPFINLIK